MDADGMKRLDGLNRDDLRAYVEWSMHGGDPLTVDEFRELFGQSKVGDPCGKMLVGYGHGKMVPGMALGQFRFWEGEKA